MHSTAPSSRSGLLPIHLVTFCRECALPIAWTTLSSGPCVTLPESAFPEPKRCEQGHQQTYVQADALVLQWPYERRQPTFKSR
jgi:hypothetical protein